MAMGVVVFPAVGGGDDPLRPRQHLHRALGESLLAAALVGRPHTVLLRAAEEVPGTVRNVGGRPAAERGELCGHLESCAVLVQAVILPRTSFFWFQV